MRKNVTVTSACTQTSSSARPRSPCSPLGISIATTGTSLRFSARTVSRAAPSSGRCRPAPNKASTTSSAPSKARGDSGSTSPVHAAAICACIAFEGFAVAQQRHPHFPAPRLQQPRHDETVAAIVAGAAQHQRLAGLPLPEDFVRDRAAGVLHQRRATARRARRRTVGRIHFGDGEISLLMACPASAGER